MLYKIIYKQHVINFKISIKSCKYYENLFKTYRKKQYLQIQILCKVIEKAIFLKYRNVSMETLSFS